MKKVSILANKKVLQKREILYQILLDDGKDYHACEEALNILLDLFGEVDLTVIKKTVANVSVVATTLNNEDNINALMSMARYYLLSDKGEISETVRVKARPDVLMTKTIVLDDSGATKTYLLIDVYEERIYFNKEELKEILQLLSLIIKLSILEEERKYAYKVDSLTRIYTRDTLLSDISKLISLKLLDEKHPVHLSVLYISNGEKLNGEKGYQYVDECLLKMVKLFLRYTDGGHVYRIGGMKFGILIKEDIQDSVYFMQQMLDRILQIDTSMRFHIMVVPIMEDANSTLYAAEKYLKELDHNKVTVFRGRPEDIIDNYNIMVCDVIEPDEEDVSYIEDKVDETYFSTHRECSDEETEIIDVDSKKGTSTWEEASFEEEDMTLDFEDENIDSVVDNSKFNGQQSLFDM